MGFGILCLQIRLKGPYTKEQSLTDSHGVCGAFFLYRTLFQGGYMSTSTVITARTRFSPLQKIERFFSKLFFSGALRTDFYRSLLILLRNQVRLNEALKTLYDIYSENGKKKQQPLPVVIRDCIDGVNNGLPFSAALAHWVPSAEGMLLQSGEKSGRLAEAFEESGKIMRAKKRIVGAIFGALAYPLVLSAMLIFLLRMVANDLVPKLVMVIDPAKWQGAGAVLRDIAEFVQNRGLTVLAGLGVLILLIVSSFSLCGGRLRVLLDKLPPWSVYRMIHGSTFLINLASLLKSGMRLHAAMEQLATVSSHWLQERIQASIVELTLGKNLGEALHDSGYGFPDQRANRFLAVIAEYSGLEVALADFAHSWMEETIERIEKISKLVLISGVALIGGTMLLIVAGVGGIQDAIQSSF